MLIKVKAWARKGYKYYSVGDRLLNPAEIIFVRPFTGYLSTDEETQLPIDTPPLLALTYPSDILEEELFIEGTIDDFYYQANNIPVMKQHDAEPEFNMPDHFHRY